MNELERRLVALGAEVEYSPTPRFDLSFAYEGRRTWRPRLRPLAIALTALVVITAGVLTFSPGARSAFLEILRIRGATVERVEKLPEVPVQRFDFGERVSRAEAERRAGFELVDVGDPEAIFVRRGNVVSLVYGPVGRPRLVLTELRGGIFEGFVKKAVAGGTTVEEVEVDGEPGLFVSGNEHYVMFRNANGQIDDESTYLAGTVLLWNRGPLLLRLEGDLKRDEALELARSVK
ncbi:MAG: hypothetical protein H0V68_10050 [Actinobacteria bacterium]|nr:hypothetical protein [Actinomycetota bacterium]